MRYTRIIVTRYGGPDALRVVEEECPEPNAGEVRVRVLAAGVSLPDLLMREGVHPETPPLPFTPGWDLVGVVDRLGAGVSVIGDVRLYWLFAPGAGTGNTSKRILGGWARVPSKKAQYALGSHVSLGNQDRSTTGLRAVGKVGRDP